jgi:hypothetical protein
VGAASAAALSHPHKGWQDAACGWVHPTPTWPEGGWRQNPCRGKDGTKQKYIQEQQQRLACRCGCASNAAQYLCALPVLLPMLWLYSQRMTGRCSPAREGASTAATVRAPAWAGSWSNDGGKGCRLGGAKGRGGEGVPQQRRGNQLGLGKRGTKRQPAALPPLTSPPKMPPHMRTSNNLRKHISDPHSTTGLRTDTATAGVATHPALPPASVSGAPAHTWGR